MHNAFKPVHTFSKILGYAPQTQKVAICYFQSYIFFNLLFTLPKRSSKKFTISGMFYTITLIILKCLLIYVSRSPKKFMKATNSDILNYGIWIQTEVSLVISLWFLLRGSFKISNKWSIMEKFVEIDKILKNEFSMNLCYMELKS